MAGSIEEKSSSIVDLGTNFTRGISESRCGATLSMINTFSQKTCRDLYLICIEVRCCHDAKWLLDGSFREAYLDSHQHNGFRHRGSGEYVNENHTWLVLLRLNAYFLWYPLYLQVSCYRWLAGIHNPNIVILMPVFFVPFFCRLKVIHDKAEQFDIEKFQLPALHHSGMLVAVVLSHNHHHTVEQLWNCEAITYSIYWRKIHNDVIKHRTTPSWVVPFLPTKAIPRDWVVFHRPEARTGIPAT